MTLFEYMIPTESKNMKCSYSPVDTQDTMLQTSGPVSVETSGILFATRKWQR